MTYGYFDSRSTQEIFALIVLDGHHKLAAAVEAGEPCDVLAIIEQTDRSYCASSMEQVLAQCAPK